MRFDWCGWCDACGCSFLSHFSYDECCRFVVIRNVSSIPLVVEAVIACLRNACCTMRRYIFVFSPAQHRRRRPRHRCAYIINERRRAQSIATHSKKQKSERTKKKLSVETNTQRFGANARRNLYHLFTLFSVRSEAMLQSPLLLLLVMNSRMTGSNAIGNYNIPST